MATKDISDVDVVQACMDAFQKAPESAGALLELRTGQHPKVVLRAMERACGRGLIDYGVSIGASWPTEQGRALLELLAHRETRDVTKLLP